MQEKTSPRDLILIIAAMSGGEVKKSLCRDICGERNYRVVMEKLRKKEEAETVFGNTPRTLLIKKNGVERVREIVPWIEEKYQRRLLAYHKDRSVRRADISQTIYNMYITGIPFFPAGKEMLYEGEKIETGKPMAYYCPAEMRERYADGLQGSRTCGLVRGGGMCILLYNMESRNIKFIKKIETRARTYLDVCTGQKTVCAMYGSGFEMVETMFKNLAYREKVRHNGTSGEINLVTADMGIYYIPNGKEGTVYFKALVHQDAVEELRRKLMEKEKKEVVSLVPVYLPSCRRLVEEKGTVVVLCLKGQRGLVEWLASGSSGNLEVRAMEESDLENFLDRL
ncbi:MAG: hypothetical protein LUE14_02920 [Clostridiales bacterium]|nr:hypothetical protein [Clostridiales bacterium]